MAKSRKSRSASAVLDDFLPPVQEWFRQTFSAPSPPQREAWPIIRGGDDTLLLAPTGSGKTLAAFLCAIDELLRRAAAGGLAEGVHVLYVSPLKALGNDIQRNLEVPLAGIRERAGVDLPEIRTAVRSGDTTQNERQRMVRKPPHILITTPESLYLLLASPRMQPHLQTVRLVIIDEIHALCGNKRGVHLAVSVERLQALATQRIQRVGCSATISPLDEVAAFLVGAEADHSARPCQIVDAGARKDLDVQAVAPLADFLEASNTALWASAYEQLLDEIKRHETTLIFANSRYKAERTVLRLRELAGDDLRIGVHHGSMSKEIRLQAEQDLKAGRLDALVATSSLELGIDIGSVDLVYQLESPKTVAAGLQRVGRAGHLLDATSKGRALIFDRGELLEAGAICRAMVGGRIDDVTLPADCLDVLAQQIAGIAANGAMPADQMLRLVRGAWPYRALTDRDFDDVLGMCAGAHPYTLARAPKPLVLWDRAAGTIAPSRGLAHICVQCAGTIPESADYEIVIAGTKKRVGTLGSEFVDDTLRIGDIFVLGSSTWRMIGVRKKTVEVEEAPGAAPTVPWWMGPIESRSVEVGREVGRMRRAIAERIGHPDLATELQSEYFLCPDAAAAVIAYMREQQAACGVVPDHERLLVETWRDELGKINVIIHAPFGMRLLRTWGTALVTAAKRELKQDWVFNASNDLILLSLGSDSKREMAPVSAERLLALVTADNLERLIDAASSGAAGLQSAFRDAAVCAFQIQRSHKGKRKPVWLLNHFAEELFAVVREHPQHPLMNEIRRNWRQQRLDTAGTSQLLRDLADKTIAVVFQEVTSPSPFAHELLITDRYRTDHQMGRERRAHLLRLHRQVLQEVLSEEQMAELLDQRAIDAVEEGLQYRSVARRARNVEELAQAIRDLGTLPAAVAAVAEITNGDAAELVAELCRAHRVVGVRFGDDADLPVHLVAAEHWRTWIDAFSRRARPKVAVPVVVDGDIERYDAVGPSTIIAADLRKPVEEGAAQRFVVERYLRTHTAVSAYELANHTGWGIGHVTERLDELVDAGIAARGFYTNQKPQPQWIEKAILEDVHHRTLKYLKRELAACAPYEVVDFLTRWQHRHPDHRLEGLDGLRTVIRQLQGFEVLQAPLEAEILAGRVADYAPGMLDQLISSGEVVWRRISAERIRRGPITLAMREDLPWLAAGRSPKFDGLGCADEDIPGPIAAVRKFFAERGSGYYRELLADTGVEPDDAQRAVWHLAWCGEIACDTFECIRHGGFEVTVSACYDLDSTPRKIVNGRMTAARVIKQMTRRRLDPGLGRWWATERLIPPVQPLPAIDVRRRWARQLLDRWGIVSKEMVAAEVASPSWAEVVREFKRMELTGELQRGYFIEHHHGEQYGLPEAIELLRDCRARREEGRELGVLRGEPFFVLTNRDPANLYTRSLDILDERGEVVKQRQRQGNLTARLVLQAGQVVVLRDNQSLVAMDHDDLRACFAEIVKEAAGRNDQVRIRSWNGNPASDCAILGLLGELEFRMDGRGHAVWPPNERYERISAPIPTTYTPYYDEVGRTQYDLDYLLNRVEDPLRGALAAFLPDLQAGLVDRGWQVEWHERGIAARFTRQVFAHSHCGKSFFDLHIRSYTLRTAEGERQRIWRRFRVTAPEDVNATLVQQLSAALDSAEAFAENFR